MRDMSPWLALAALIVGVDQATKYIAVNYFSENPPIAVTPFFNLVLVHNPGAAFSFLSEAGGWQRFFFITIAVAASVWILMLLRRHSGQRLFALALTLILGGAIGNVIDRILVGVVVDFLDFHAFGWHWPAFNVADAAITCGAALLVWEAFKPHADAVRKGEEDRARGV
jgi:signal peptidase II